MYSFGLNHESVIRDFESFDYLDIAKLYTNRQFLRGNYNIVICESCVQMANINSKLTGRATCAVAKLKTRVGLGHSIFFAAKLAD